MASLLDTLQLLRQPLASGLKNALEVYGHITPPNEEDDSDCARFIGCYLVELNKEQQLHNKRLQMIELYASGGSPTFSSQNNKIDAIQEEIRELKSSVENVEDKVQDIEDTLKIMEERFDSLESKVDSLETKFDKVMFEQDV